MNDLSAEKQFFIELAPKIIEFVKRYDGKISVNVSKAVGNYATEIDLAVEEIIVNEIQTRFPGDEILAEEGHSDTPIPDGRIWIIDPICGTTNLRRGLKYFCTNIALVNNRELVASCVVDHSDADYFWSIGNNEVFMNDQLVSRPEQEDNLGWVVDVDIAAAKSVNLDSRKRYAAFIGNISSNDGYTFMSMSSSLAFAYAAIGKIDGFIAPFCHTWDIAAASFLMTQSGGIMTKANRDDWDLSPTISSIGSLYPEVHRQILDACITAGY